MRKYSQLFPRFIKGNVTTGSNQSTEEQRQRDSRITFANLQRSNCSIWATELSRVSEMQTACTTSCAVVFVKCINSKNILSYLLTPSEGLLVPVTALWLYVTAFPVSMLADTTLNCRKMLCELQLS